MIGFAQSHFGPATRPNLRFEVADGRCLPFQNEFDLVVSFNALHWIPDQDAALSSIHSALFPVAKRSFGLSRQVRARVWKMSWKRHVERRNGALTSGIFTILICT